MKSKCTCCWRCKKNRKIKPNGALCEQCCHEEFHGVVRKDLDGAWKFFAKSAEEVFDEKEGNFVSAVSWKRVPRTTVLCCELCLTQIRPAATA